jgi:hypothetical protein
MYCNETTTIIERDQMFAFSRKLKLTESDADNIARLHPGMLVIASDFIKVYLGDVDCMTTTYVKTKKMSKAEALELIKRTTASARHHQIYV